MSNIKRKKESNGSKGVPSYASVDSGTVQTENKKQPEDPNINKHAKESRERKHNDIEQDNES